MGFFQEPHAFFLMGRLSLKTKDKILHYSSMEINPTWFSDMGQGAMYSGHFEESFLEDLNKLLSKTEESLLFQLKSNAESNISSFTKDSEFFSAHFFSHIACKEINFFKENSTFGFVFKGEKLVDANEPIGKLNCDFLGITTEQVRPYSALHYK